MTRYRDKRNGRFASKQNWERSHGPEGNYVREEILEEEEEEETGEEQEWIASASYEPGKNRKTSAVAVQLHVFAPANWTKTQVKESFDSWRQESNEIEDLASFGLRASVITWEHRRKGEGSGEAEAEWENFNRLPLNFAIEGE